MRRKRLTREDSREQTHERLLDAARKLITRQGLDGSSVEDIAAAAGYSRGAFYSNFASKNDLFIELLRREHQRTHLEFLALVNDDIPLDEIQASTRRIYGELYRDNEYCMTWTEARLLSARDPKFRVIEYFCRRAGAAPPLPPPAMAMGLMGLVEGVRLFGASSPQEMSPQTAELILSSFVDALMQVSRPPAAVSVKAAASDRRKR
jgi:AcrR family transcriptional regulator